APSSERRICIQARKRAPGPRAPGNHSDRRLAHLGPRPLDSNRWHAGAVQAPRPYFRSEVPRDDAGGGRNQAAAMTAGRAYNKPRVTHLRTKELRRAILDADFCASVGTVPTRLRAERAYGPPARVSELHQSPSRTVTRRRQTTGDARGMGSAAR